MDSDLRRQLIILAAYVLTVVTNGLAVALPLNGQSTAEISDRYLTLITPAGYVFAIWSVIYALLLAFSVYQALPSHRADPPLRAIGYLSAVAAILNSIWLVLWHYNVFVLTVPVMVALLLTLIAIYVRLGIGARRAATWTEAIAVRLPWSVYLGWITIATIANVATTLVWLEWDGLGIAPDVWAAAVLVVGAAIATAMALTRRDLAYGLVIVWAYIGIAVNHPDTALVVSTAALGAAVVGGFAVWSVAASRRAVRRPLA
jgi:hypothetical protein